jgi:hypothetical protein
MRRQGFSFLAGWRAGRDGRSFLRYYSSATSVCVRAQGFDCDLRRRLCQRSFTSGATTAAARSGTTRPPLAQTEKREDWFETAAGITNRPAKNFVSFMPGLNRLKRKNRESAVNKQWK